MQETRVRFRSGSLELEGLLYRGHGAQAVVVTHPHPLYGGDMFNPVVEAIVSAYRQCGFDSLRFNVRGTGRSSGSHDQGNGEQEDVAAAVAFMAEQAGKPVHLAGYSFGAWISGRVIQQGLSVPSLTMVAPPVALIPFDDRLYLPLLSTVVAGSEDEIAPPALIEPQLAQWNPRAQLEVIQGADHFFFGFLDEVTRRLVRAIRAQ